MNYLGLLPYKKKETETDKEWIGLGIESQIHALATRYDQITYSQVVLADNQRNYDSVALNIKKLIKIYTVSHKGHIGYLAHLKKKGLPPSDPEVQEARKSISEATLYLKGLNICLRQAVNTYKETREKNVDAIRFWQKEATTLEKWLSGPGFKRLGWVWERDEPSDYEDGDEGYKFHQRPEIWDEYNVYSDEDFI